MNIRQSRITEETKSYEQRLIEQIINNLIKGNFKMLQRSCKHYFLYSKCELICEISNVKYRVFFEDYTDHLKIFEIEDIDNINLDKSLLVFKGVFFNHEAELFYDKMYGIQ